MPGSTFPHHMTSEWPVGLIFKHYDYLHTFDNHLVEETLSLAAGEINQDIADDPALRNQTMALRWAYEYNPLDLSEDYFSLSLHPDFPAMTYGDIPIVIAALATWSTQYRTVETDFDIWAWPGTREQRMLGVGSLKLEIL